MKQLLRIFFPALFCLVDAMAAEQILRLATTTSTENTGLLETLNPPFERQYNARVHVIAVGTGQALKLAEDGNVDLVFVHAPEAEQAFIEKGYGIERRPVMHNDFILLGPAADPAGAGRAGSLAEAMRRIQARNCLFVSRGDESGTHRKEMELWEKSTVKPGGAWYRTVGQGMGPVLLIADELRAYTLSDRGTYLAYGGKISLKTVFENDELLANPYHIILINPEKHPRVKVDLARRYSDFVTGEEGQKIIREFRINGQPLFYPDAIR